MNLELSPQELAFREEVRDWLRTALAPELRDKIANFEKLTKEEILGWNRTLADKGWAAPEWPVEWGGTDWTPVQRYIFEEEYAYAGAPPIAPFGPTMCASVLLQFGTEEQKKRFLPRIYHCDDFWCQGYSEPGAGSDVVSMRTRADRKGDRYVLNGSKMWITNGGDADTLVVYAKTEPDAGPRGITAFLVERGFKGFRPAQKLDKLGMRGSHTGELVFQDCEVPAENVLGGIGEDPLTGVGRGVNVLMSGLDFERAVLSGGPLGIMEACMDVVVPYLHERKQFGQPIGTFQLMQAKVADMHVAMMATRAYVYEGGRQCDRSRAGEVDVRSLRKDAAGAILFSAEKATWMAGEAIQCLGGNGYINDYATGRLWRDAKLYEIGAGTSEIRRMLIGRELFNETR
ncbi:MAG: acyl-CoA dehydrogenase family protein [Gammaproteobacteria bacterium]